MDVSVVVVNLNGRELLPGCLGSIPPGVETIVVDNGSTDGSPEDIFARFPAVTLLQNPVNRGFAAAVNQGIERSRGRHVCLFNSDARFTPGALETLVRFLEEHPDAGIAAPRLLHEDGRRQHSFDALPSPATALLNKSILRKIFPGDLPAEQQGSTEPLDVPSVIGACMAVRRDLIDRIGALDETYFLFLEETDWCLRARRAGFRVVFVPSAKVVHLQGRTRDKAAVRARIEYTRSLFTYFGRHRPGFYPVLRLLHPVKNLVELLFQTIGAMLTLFLVPGLRRRWIETAALAGWQLLLCPRRFGLSGAPDPVYRRPRPGWLVAAEYGDAFRDFDRAMASGRVLKDLRYKRTVECETGGKTFLVKTYKTSTWPRRLKSLLFGSRAAHELKVSLEVRRRGLPTAPIAAVAGNSVIIEKLPGWTQLRQVLLSADAPPARRRALLSAYGRFARRLHDAGLWQYDFNPSNILVSDMEFKVIDFEMAHVRGCLTESARLLSLAKMNRLPRLSRADRLRFLKGYVRSREDEERRLGEIVAEIRRFGEAQEAIDAGRAGRRCMGENRDFAGFEIGDVSGRFRRDREERPGTGLPLEELRRLAAQDAAPEGFRFQPVEAALGEWKRANILARKGAPAPLAVLVKKGGGRGVLVFRKPA